MIMMGKFTIHTEVKPQLVLGKAIYQLPNLGISSLLIIIIIIIIDELKCMFVHVRPSETRHA